MLYVLIAEDIADSLPLRIRHRTEHRQRLEALQSQGRLVLAGPFPALDAADPGQAGFSGSLIVADFPSHADALTWVNADPYSRHGVFGQVTIRPFQQVFPL